MEPDILRVEKIEKWYGSVHALRGVDFSVASGEVVGLIGENGAGKSSLIKIISGLYSPDAGRIFWKGKEVKIESVKKARELGIETVHQIRLTIDNLDVSENIFLARELRKRLGPISYIDKAAQDRRAAELIRELGLNIESPRKKVESCSGAEKQGVEVARALEFKADLLILDEPTVGLSLAGIDQLRQFVRSMTSRGMGCIFITHNFRHVLDLAHRFVVMVRGMVVDELVNRDLSVEQIESMLLG
jgi:simple sugar transport system ATP-binding protein